MAPIPEDDEEDGTAPKPTDDDDGGTMPMPNPDDDDVSHLFLIDIS